MLIDIKNIHNGKVFKIKDKNKADIFHLLCNEKHISRKSVGHILNIRPATTSNLVEELVNDKLVTESDSLNVKGRGRPEKSLIVNYNVFLCIAVYVDSNNLKGVLLNFNEEILYSCSVNISEHMDNDFFISQIINLIENILNYVPKTSELIGIGFSLTGYLDKNNRILTYTSRWPQIKNLQLDIIEKRFGCKLRVHQEVNTLLKYFLLSDSSLKNGGTAILHWGYGIGAGYSMDGNILYPSTGGALEIGHLQFIKDNPVQCKCGSYGCLETVAAAWAMEKELKKFLHHTVISEKDYSSIINNEELDIIPVVEEAIEHMAVAMNYIYTLFGPERIILSGPFYNNDKIFSKVTEKFRALISKHCISCIDLKKINSISGCEAFGCTYDFFEEKLQHKMISQYNWK
jgi:predicted NBD/HSP70 family sugar kinase